MGRHRKPADEAPESSGLDAFADRLKALADEGRLRIVALLDERPRSVEELAASTGLTASTVSHHLAKLRRAGFVTSERDQYYEVYSVNQTTLKETGLMLANGLVWRSWTAARGETDAYDDDVLSRVIVDGRLPSLPTRRAHRAVVLRHFARRFERGRGYTEAQVDALLGALHDDPPAIRRELVWTGLLDRSRGEYRRP